jgi:uncharacterized protein (DUF4213/DUF364 family)
MTHPQFIQLLLKEIDRTADCPVTAITYGAHMVAVESSKTGVATWAWTDHPVPLESLPEPVKSDSAKNIARMIADENPLTASLGMAALNAILPDLPSRNLIDRNAGALTLDLGKGKNVAVIGHFPFVEKMKGKFRQFMVFEKKPRSGDLEESCIPEKLPSADVVAVTATTIANKSLGHILAHCRKDAVKLIIGPSTPMCSAMFELGFDYVAGSIVEDTARLKQGIVEGCSFKQAKGVKHVILQSR